MTTKTEMILDMLERRDEAALHALTAQYGSACRKIAMQILGNEQDAQEVWNDALMHIWRAIPPAKPDDLHAYLCTVVRNLSYQRLEKRNAKKRGGGLSELSLDAISERRQPSGNEVETLIDEMHLIEAMQRFLDTLTPDARTIFVAHYGSGRTLREIAEVFQLSFSKVAVTLMRTRIKLRKYLEEEGWL